jgi:uncharacterized membrane protein
MKIDWKRKFSSRKFWMALVGFVTPLLLAFGMSESETAEIAAIIIAGANVIIYVLAEASIDTANKTKGE